MDCFAEDRELQCVRKNTRRSISTNATPTRRETTLAVDTKNTNSPIFVGLELECEFGVASRAFEGLMTAPVVDQ